MLKTLRKSRTLSQGWHRAFYSGKSFKRKRNAKCNAVSLNPGVGQTASANCAFLHNQALEFSSEDSLLPLPWIQLKRKSPFTTFQGIHIYIWKKRRKAVYSWTQILPHRKWAQSMWIIKLLLSLPITIINMTKSTGHAALPEHAGLITDRARQSFRGNYRN